MTKVVRRFACLALFCALTLTALAAPHAAHVFILSIDGGKPAVIQESDMPVLKQLVAQGAHTWEATTIFPSLTLPSHTSMLTGVGPDKHHILWNDWHPDRGLVPVPTVFSYAKAAGLSTAMFVGKEKFRHLLLTNSVDEFDYNPAASAQVTKSDNGDVKPHKEGTVFAAAVARDAAAYIVAKKPNLCFIHFADPDTMGHKFGWGSREQIEAFAKTDAALGEVMKAIHQAGIAKNSVVIITADHGGHGHGHGTSSPEDMHIPWIAWGKDVKPDFTITAPVNTCDTAATALWLLGVPPPDSLDGKPVTSAFEQLPSQGSSK